MVLAALGTIGVAAWVSLLDARGQQVEANVEGLQRRVVARNSRALAHQAIYANHLPSSSGHGSPTTYTMPGGLGECTIGSYPEAPLAESDSQRVSRNGATPLLSYTTDVNVAIPNGAGTEIWQFQLRAASPFLGGDLLAVHPPANFEDSRPLVSGSLIVEGRALFWDAVASDFGAGFRADEVLLPNQIHGVSSFPDSSGVETLPLNYPLPLQTTGLSSTGDAYVGSIEVFSPSPNPHNSYRERIISSGASEEVDGLVAVSRGGGPDTRAPGPDDAELAARISTDPPDVLVDYLEDHAPLSSLILLEVLEKSNPAFSESQLLAVFADQGLMPDDVLSELAGTHADRIREANDIELAFANEVSYQSDGSGRVDVFLRNPTLPHLVAKNVARLHLHGQDDDTDDGAAAALPARIILVDNDASPILEETRLHNKNARPIALALSSPVSAPATTTFFFEGSVPFPEWHAVVELRHTEAVVDTSAVSEGILVGGLRTNRHVDVASGVLRIRPQHDPRGLELLLSRNAWIEAYQL